MNQRWLNVQTKKCVTWPPCNCYPISTLLQTVHHWRKQHWLCITIQLWKLSFLRNTIVPLYKTLYNGRILYVVLHWQVQDSDQIMNIQGTSHALPSLVSWVSFVFYLICIFFFFKEKCPYHKEFQLYSQKVPSHVPCVVKMWSVFCEFKTLSLFYLKLFQCFMQYGAILG